MGDLTQNTELIFDMVKSFVDVTWSDPDTDYELNNQIQSSISFLNDTAGVELDYTCQFSTDSVLNSMNSLGQELLKNRVFYMREKALDDFAKNYLGELNKLYLLGVAYKEVNKNVEQQ